MNQQSKPQFLPAMDESQRLVVDTLDHLHRAIARICFMYPELARTTGPVMPELNQAGKCIELLRIGVGQRYDETCPRCQADYHRCPGCGEPLPHNWQCCVRCSADIRAEAAMARIQDFDNGD